MEPLAREKRIHAVGETSLPERRHVVLGLLVGVLYVVPIAWESEIAAVVSRDHPPTNLVQQATQTQWRHFAVLLPSLIALAFQAVSGGGPVVKAFRGTRVRAILATCAATALLSLLLNAAGAWPFTWRWSTNQTFWHAQALVADKAWSPLFVWGLVGLIVVPLLEETAFRFGLLGLVWRLTGSTRAAVLVSSLVFASFHLGGIAKPVDVPHAVNSLALFLGSLLLGTAVVRRSGNIGVAIVAHATRNALEFGSLILATYLRS